VGLTSVNLLLVVQPPRSNARGERRSRCGGRASRPRLAPRGASAWWASPDDDRSGLRRLAQQDHALARRLGAIRGVTTARCRPVRALLEASCYPLLHRSAERRGLIRAPARAAQTRRALIRRALRAERGVSGLPVYRRYEALLLARGSAVVSSYHIVLPCFVPSLRPTTPLRQRVRVPRSFQSCDGRRRGFSAAAGRALL